MILTENILNAKSKGQSYPNIKQINLCGMHLSDVSIMKDLRLLEVVVLSVNDLTTLIDLENVSNLRELHVRKNQIDDISQVKFLKNLSKLRILSLTDNPCVVKAGIDYRLHVIHELPNLEVLDNLTITPEEKSLAEDPKYAILRKTSPVYRRQKTSASIREVLCYQENVEKPKPSRQSMTSSTSLVSHSPSSCIKERNSNISSTQSSQYLNKTTDQFYQQKSSKMNVTMEETPETPMFRNKTLQESPKKQKIIATEKFSKKFGRDEEPLPLPFSHRRDFPEDDSISVRTMILEKERELSKSLASPKPKSPSKPEPITPRMALRKLDNLKKETKPLVDKLIEKEPNSPRLMKRNEKVQVSSPSRKEKQMKKTSPRYGSNETFDEDFQNANIPAMLLPRACYYDERPFPIPAMPTPIYEDRAYYLPREMPHPSSDYFRRGHYQIPFNPSSPRGYYYDYNDYHRPEYNVDPYYRCFPGPSPMHMPPQPYPPRATPYYPPADYKPYKEPRFLEFHLGEPATRSTIQNLTLKTPSSCHLAAALCLVQSLKKNDLYKLDSLLKRKLKAMTYRPRTK